MKLLQRLKNFFTPKAPPPYERFITPLPDGGVVETLVCQTREQADRICAARKQHLVHRVGLTATFEYR